MSNFCIDCGYLSVNRVNGIEENSIFSSELRAELHCASHIPNHMCLSAVNGICTPMCKFYDYITVVNSCITCFLCIKGVLVFHSKSL